MPNIREGNLIREDIRAVDGGLSTRAATARRIGAFSNELAGAMDDVAVATRRTGAAFEAAADTAGSVVDKEVTRRQISQGGAAFARKSEELTQRWENTIKSADPNDPTVAVKFRETMETDLEKLKGGFLTEGGQRFAESRVQELRNHFFKTTAGDMAKLAGKAATINMIETTNSLSNTVKGDPSSLDFALKTLEQTAAGVVGSNPHLTGVQAVQVRDELVHKGKDQIIKAAAFGYIQRTGQVPEWATEPRFAKYIDGTELKRFEAAARTEQRMARTEQREIEAQAKLNAKISFHQEANKLEAATIPQNVGDTPRLPANYWQELRRLQTHPGADLEPGLFHRLIKNGEAITNQMNKPEPLGPVSHETTIDLMSKMRSGELTDTGPVYDAFGEGKLNRTDFNFLVKEFRDNRSPEGDRWNKSLDRFIGGVKAQITHANPMLGKLDQTGDEALYRFEMMLRAKASEYRAAKKNPYDLLDPSKPDYMGKPEALQPYQKPMQDSVLDRARSLRRSNYGNLTGPGKDIISIDKQDAPLPVTPRKPGESLADYERRKGGR